jgi:hypothetical protein
MEIKVSERLQKKWASIIEHKAFGEIKDSYRKHVTTVLLENQQANLAEAAPSNSIGDNPGSFGTSIDQTRVNTWDPILISLVRRSMPNLIAYDICGVQPLNGPTGLIFALRSKYNNQDGDEALFLEADAKFGGSGATAGYSGVGFTGGYNFDTDSRAVDPFSSPLDSDRQGMITSRGDALGDSTSNPFKEMAFTIEKTIVEAKTRALKAEWSLEMQQDLKATHGLDAETELTNILSNEIMAEINREVVRTIYNVARTGARTGQTQTAGTFDLNVDSNGRWSVEKFKGMLFQIERECNAIAKETRRGKGNFLLCDSDTAAALSMAGVLDYAPALSTNLQVDDTGNTFAGTLNGKIKVYIDPYVATTRNFFCVGYKGSSPYDAGIFYCPYVPLQMVRAVGQDSFQPKIGFKTRYGIVSNPFVFGADGNPDAMRLGSGRNQYYRKVLVSNLF